MPRVHLPPVSLSEHARKRVRVRFKLFALAAQLAFVRGALLVAGDPITQPNGRIAFDTDTARIVVRVHPEGWEVVTAHHLRPPVAPAPLPPPAPARPETDARDAQDALPPDLPDPPRHGFDGDPGPPRAGNLRARPASGEGAPMAHHEFTKGQRVYRELSLGGGHVRRDFGKVKQAASRGCLVHFERPGLGKLWVKACDLRAEMLVDPRPGETTGSVEIPAFALGEGPAWLNTKPRAALFDEPTAENDDAPPSEEPETYAEEPAATMPPEPAPAPAPAPPPPPSSAPALAVPPVPLSRAEEHRARRAPAPPPVAPAAPPAPAPAPAAPAPSPSADTPAETARSLVSLLGADPAATFAALAAELTRAARARADAARDARAALEAQLRLAAAEEKEATAALVRLLDAMNPPRTPDPGR